MKTHSFLLLSSLACAAQALRIPFSSSHRSLHARSRSTKLAVSRPAAALANTKVLASASGSDDVDITTVKDLLYLANITVGGQEYTVQLDTGSSDLWVKGDSSPLPNTNQTSTTFNLTYGIGWAYGHISQASMEIAGISIPSQAFIDVSSASNPVLSYGAQGVLGLGFTSLSNIDSILNKTGSAAGRSVLFNAFSDNPSEPNFIAFSLERSDDNADSAEGTFSIGEYESAYASVANTTAIPTYPETSPNRWNILLEAYIVGNQTYSLSSSVSGAPSGKAVALMDSGTSYTYCSTDMAQAIYGGIDGAKFDDSLQQWVVPCDAEVDMALQFGGRTFAIHPLDLVPYSLSDPTSCVGSFVPQSVAVGNGEFDLLVGDNVLRSVYSVYDFGDFDSSGNMGNPYMKLLSVVDPDEASKDFHSQRGGTARTGITYTPSNAAGTSSAGSSSGSSTTTISDSLADTLNKLVDYIPAMLAILGLNAVVLLVAITGGLCYFIRRRGKNARRKDKKNKQMNDMPLVRTSSPAPGSVRSQQHIYEPVSNAMPPEDAPFVPPNVATDPFAPSADPRASIAGPSKVAFPLQEDAIFEPPAPAFHGYDGNGPRAGLRPKSMLTVASGSWGGSGYPYRASAASDATAVGQLSPTWKLHDKDDDNDSPKGGRPMSMA